MYCFFCSVQTCLAISNEVRLQMFNILLAYGWKNTLDLVGARMLNADEIYHSKEEIIRLMKQNGYDQGREFVKPARGLEDGCIKLVCNETHAGAYMSAA